MIEEINHILNNWDYTKALDFLRKHGTNPHLAEILSAGESKFFTKKLRLELEKIKDSSIPSEAQTPIHNDFNKSPAGKALDKANDSIESIKSERNRILREQDQLRWQNVLMVEEEAPLEKRAEISKRIMELSHKLHELWYKLDYHHEHGILPPEATDPVMEVFIDATSESDLVKIRNNYRSYVTKAKKGTRQEKLPFYQAVVAEADKRIELAQ